jgi:hypothetical protein
MSERTHILLQRELERDLDWERWKKRWNEVKTPEELIGLLHCGFSVSAQYPAGYVDRVCFYLNVADGYSESESFFLSPSERERGLVSDRLERAFKKRQAVAMKAWTMLCDHFFKKSEDRERTTWPNLVIEKPIFEKLLWFFGPLEEIGGRDNFPPRSSEKHDDLTALVFLFEFVRFAWEFVCRDRHSGERDEKIREMFRAERPRLVRILECIGELDFLLRREDIDESVLGKLKEMALRKYLWFDKKYRTIPEAIYEGSEAARVYLLLRVKQGEEKRRERFKEAERTARAANQVLTRLQP